VLVPEPQIAARLDPVGGENREAGDFVKRCDARVAVPTGGTFKQSRLQPVRGGVEEAVGAARLVGRRQLRTRITPSLRINPTMVLISGSASVP
jgi:hypothetical protein